MITLIEASKLLPNEGERTIVQVYAQAYDPLLRLPIRPEPTGLMRWTVANGLPTTAGRAVNADFPAASGSSDPYEASTKIYGGTMEIDTYIVKTNPNAVPQEKLNQINSLARKTVKDLFEGEGGASFRGIRDWVTEDFTTQNLTMGSTSGGVLLSMAKMDELVNAVNVIPGQTAIYMSQAPFNYLNTLSRTNGAGQQNIVYAPNEFGNQIPTYAGIPVIVLKDLTGTDILSATETDSAFTGGSATSVYAVTFDTENFTGFGPENSIEARDFQTKIEAMTAQLQWIVGVAPRHARAVARLNNVKNAIA